MHAQAWTSSLIAIICVPLATYVTMRIKVRYCDKFRRLPALFHCDLRSIMITNVTSYALMILWGNRVAIEALLAVDILVGIPIERWLIRIIHRTETAPYHPPGPLGQKVLRRRRRIAIAVAILFRSLCAAIVSLLPLYDDEHEMREYLFTATYMPVLYTIYRTLMIDSYRPATVNAEQEHEVTNAFVLSSREEEDDKEEEEFE